MEVLQKPNPQNHKNCKKKHRKLCKNHAKSTPSGSFWGDFGVILVPLGVLWRPWAPQGTPQGSRGEKTTKKGVRRPPPRDPFWGPLGDLGRHRADIFFVFGCRVGDRCADRRSDGQNVLHKRSPRPPPTMKTKVSPTRKRRFHIYTSTSRMTENGLPWVPFQVACGCLAESHGCDR